MNPVLMMEEWIYKGKPHPDCRCEVILADGRHHIAHFGQQHFFDFDLGMPLEDQQVVAWRVVYEKPHRHH